MITTSQFFRDVARLLRLPGARRHEIAVRIPPSAR